MLEPQTHQKSRQGLSLSTPKCAEGSVEAPAAPLASHLPALHQAPRQPPDFTSTTALQREGKEAKGRKGREGERVFLVLNSGAELFLSAADSVNAFPGRQLALY